MHSLDERLRRPLGFYPAEVSARINADIVDQHAREAALLWTQRTRAVVAPHFKLKHLVKLDGRVLAHLRGLEVAGDAGWDAAKSSLAALEAGSLFVAAQVAFASRDTARMQHVLQLAVTEPELERALISALGWIDRPLCSAVVARLCASGVGPYRRVGLAAVVEHRLEPEQALAAAARDADPEVRALALRAIGECGGDGLDVTLDAGMRDDERRCRFWAARSIALRNHTAAARSAYQWGCEEPALQAAAVEIALRCGGRDWARDVVRSLAAQPEQRRLAIDAIGAFGDPAAIPWLLEQMRDPQHARRAGEAFALITGVDLAYEDLTLDAGDDDSEATPEADVELPLPDAAAVQQWWMGHRDGFAPETRYLAGRPVSSSAALETIRHGYQRQRAAAALELAIQTGGPLFPISERADWQRRRLER